MLCRTSGKSAKKKRQTSRIDGTPVAKITEAIKKDAEAHIQLAIDNPPRATFSS